MKSIKLVLKKNQEVVLEEVYTGKHASRKARQHGKNWEMMSLSNKNSFKIEYNVGS